MRRLAGLGAITLAAALAAAPALAQAPQGGAAPQGWGPPAHQWGSSAQVQAQWQAAAAQGGNQGGAAGGNGGQQGWVSPSGTPHAAGQGAPGIAPKDTAGTTTSSANPGQPGLTNRSTVNPGIATVENPHKAASNAQRTGDAALAKTQGDQANGQSGQGQSSQSQSSQGQGGQAGATPAPQADRVQQNKTEWDNAQGKNPALTKNGLIRAKKILDATVYNKEGKAVGSIDDVILPQDGRSAEAIVRLKGGVLNAGTKLVAVPFQEVQVSNDNPDQHKVILTQVSGSSLYELPDYAYDSSDQDNGLKPSLKRSLGSNGQHG